MELEPDDELQSEFEKSFGETHKRARAVSVKISCLMASMMLKTQFWKFIRELEEQKLRTGEQCCFGCTFVGVNNMALMLKLQAMKAGEEAGIKSVTLLN